MPTRDVSEERKVVFYAGVILATIGVLIFGSNFVSFALHFGERLGPEFGKSFALRGFGGMALIIIGGVLQRIGRVGLAGAGVLLDPQQARKDVEPWSRMQGGVLKDTLDEAGLDLSRLGGTAAAAPEEFDEKLRKLHQLHQDGILSKEEYDCEKAEVLSRI